MIRERAAIETAFSWDFLYKTRSWSRSSFIICRFKATIELGKLRWEDYLPGHSGTNRNTKDTPYARLLMCVFYMHEGTAAVKLSKLKLGNSD